MRVSFSPVVGRWQAAASCRDRRGLRHPRTPRRDPRSWTSASGNWHWKWRTAWNCWTKWWGRLRLGRSTCRNLISCPGSWWLLGADDPAHRPVTTFKDKFSAKDSIKSIEKRMFAADTEINIMPWNTKSTVINCRRIFIAFKHATQLLIHENVGFLMEAASFRLHSTEIWKLNISRRSCVSFGFFPHRLRTTSKLYVNLSVKPGKWSKPSCVIVIRALILQEREEVLPAPQKWQFSTVFWCYLGFAIPHPALQLSCGISAFVR